MIEIRDMAGPSDLAEIRQLFTDYAEWLARDYAISLEFQGFEEEMAALPGKYTPPEGAMLLIGRPGRPSLGCIALRPFEPGVCEVCLLYTSDAADD